MRVESIRDSSPNSCRSGQGSRGISVATQSCARRPTAALDVSCTRSRPTSPHQCGVYEEGNLLHQWRYDRSDYHTLCQGRDVVVPSRWVRAARPQRLQVFPSVTSCRGRWQPRLLQREDRPRPQRVRSFSFRVFLGPLDLAPFFTLKPCLAQTAVRRLPLPLDSLEFFTIPHESCPQPFEYSVSNPSLKPAMNGTIVPEDLRHMVPLTARAHPKENTVQCFPQIRARASRACRWIQILKHRLDALPYLIRDLPNRLQRYVLDLLLARHPILPLQLTSAPYCQSRHQVQATEGVLR